MAVQYSNRLRGRTVMVLPASCPKSVVVTMASCKHKVKTLDIPLGWGVVTNYKCIKTKNNMRTSHLQPGKCAVSTIQGHNRDL